MDAKLTDWLERNRLECDMCPPPMSAGEFEHYIVKYLLGDDFVLVDSLGVSQVRSVALLDVLKKHSAEFRKEYKEYLNGNERD